MHELITNRGDIRSELNETVRCFIPDTTESGISVNFTYVRSARVTFFIGIGDTRYTYSYDVCPYEDKLRATRYDLYICKHALYRALSDYFGKTLPWGSLTGIRPTRIAVRLSESGVSPDRVAARMVQDYLVSPEKAALTARILNVQEKHMSDRLHVACDTERGISGLVNLYVHIPFCPTRCAYCSFVSQGVEKQRWLLKPYVDALLREIELTKEWIAERHKRIFSVYIGGGTPTVLSPELLYRVAKAAFVPHTEYTCEAGRPDTVTSEKMHVLAECGVNRVSVNPQTLHDATLRKIGRAHTAAQFFEAYRVAQDFGFVKNVDLIAGLEGESRDDFVYTVKGVLALRPENVTVHTLCRKRGSAAAQEEDIRNRDTQDMVDYSVTALTAAGYDPYYLYRQKQMTANLENIGWCRDGFLCVNNVSVMEETLSVCACGAGAIEKSVLPNGKIARHANPKDVLLYLREFEERMRKKRLFYENQFTCDA